MQSNNLTCKIMLGYPFDTFVEKYAEAKDMSLEEAEEIILEMLGNKDLEYSSPTNSDFYQDKIIGLEISPYVMDWNPYQYAIDDDAGEKIPAEAIYWSRYVGLLAYEFREEFGFAPQVIPCVDVSNN